MPNLRSGFPPRILLILAAALPSGTAQGQQKQRDVITRQEILQSAHVERDLYTTIRSLRPHFMAAARGVRTMGVATVIPRAVYVDGTRLADVTALRAIPAKDVEEVRYLDPSKAEEVYGIGHSGGAIEVKLARKGRP